MNSDYVYNWESFALEWTSCGLLLGTEDHGRSAVAVEGETRLGHRIPARSDELRNTVRIQRAVVGITFEFNCEDARSDPQNNQSNQYYYWWEIVLL